MKSIIPASFSAGLTFSATVCAMAYPASAGWAVTLLLRGPQSIDIAGTPDGDKHDISATAAQTAAWQPGIYSYMVRATLGDDVYAVENGTMTITPDVSSIAAGTDQRSHAKRVLDAINAVIEKRATQDQQRYSINNRELWRTPMKDLLALRAAYLAQVAQENAIAAGRSRYGKSVRVRFTVPR